MQRMPLLLMATMIALDTGRHHASMVPPATCISFLVGIVYELIVLLACARMSVCLSRYVWLCMVMYVCMYACMYVCMYVCMNVRIYVYVHTCIHTCVLLAMVVASSTL